MSGHSRSDLVARLGSIGKVDAEFGSLTTYRVGGHAAIGIHPSTRDDLVRIAKEIPFDEIPIVIVGNGSNILVADHGFLGCAIFTDALPELIDLPERNELPVGTEGRALVSANVSLPVLARRSASAGWSGLEWAVGVPGTVGGAVRMNAGGHGSDIASSLRSALVFSFASGEFRTLSADDLGFRFRGSSLDDKSMVIEATFLVRAEQSSRSTQHIDEIVKWRRENQPGGQNAGSVFVNPIPNELSAGKLIDDLGLRGKRIGTAEVSTKHANFIQSDPGGSADDVVRLMAFVRAKVEASTGIALRSEIRLIGFSDEMTLAAGGTVRAL